MRIKKLALPLVVAALFAGMPAHAETVEAKGTSDEISIQESGSLLKARKLAKKAADRDAVMAALKNRMNISKSNPAVQEAVDDLVKQLSDNLQTSYSTDGDLVTAKSVLSAEASNVYELARSIDGLISSKSMAKIVFIIDEYFGIGTVADPSQPTSTEIKFHQDRSSTSASSKSAAGASSSKDAIAIAASSKSSVAASDSASVSARERGSYSGSQQRGVAVSDAYGNSGAAASDTRVAGSRDASLDASRKSSYAGAQQSSFAGAASSERAAAHSSSSASASSQKDITDFSFKQTFPGLDNAKPSDTSVALISKGLEEVAKKFGLEYVPEKDIRTEKGSRLLISDMERLGKFDAITQKAAKQPYMANYIVYGTAVMSSGPKTASGDVTCSGALGLTSYNVGTNTGLVSKKLTREAQGRFDQECRQRLAAALSEQAAQAISLEATKELQLKSVQGESFYVFLYSAKKIKSSIMLAFPDLLKSISKDMQEDPSKDLGWSVKAKEGFINKLRALVSQMSEENLDAKNARIIVKGGQIAVSIDGTAPKGF